MKIRVHQHPFSDEPPLIFEPDCSFAKWLLDRYETRPRPQIFVGEPSAETDISTDAAAILRGDAPEYVLLESPAGPLLPYVVNFIISYAIGAAVNFLFAKDRPEQNLNRGQESPNNSLSNRENRVRALERVEDIYGTVRAIPSLMMPTYRKYVDNRAVEYGYYCVGRGYYDISDIRDGDTALSGILGASAAVYAPFTSPNSGSPQLLIGDPIIDTILTVTRSSAIDGITIKPTNQLQLTAGIPYMFRGPGSSSVELPVTSSVDIIYQAEASRRPNFAAVCEVGQTLTVSMANTGTIRELPVTYSLTAVASTKTITTDRTGFFRGVADGSTITIPDFLDATNQTAKTIVSHTGESITVAEALADEVLLAGGPISVGMFINYTGFRTISAVESGYVLLSSGPFLYPDAPEEFTLTLTVDNDLQEWTDWVTLADDDRTEVWINTVALNGMFKDDGAKSGTSVAYEVQVEQLTSLLVPTGTVETYSGSISGATSNLRAETLEHVTAWTGPARVRMRRTTPFDYDFQGFVQDEISWVDLYSVSPVSKSHFGNKTTIHTVTRANQDATSLRRRELNCLASRLLPTYNGTTFSGAFDSDGLLASGTIAATSKIVDIIAAVAVDPKIGNLDLATEVDMAQIWSVQQALDAWNVNCGQFNYTFDSDSLSFEETADAIAQAAFCKPYRQNGKIRLALDRPQSTNSALFTHRNKKPRSEAITRRFASDAEYDGIELVYQDPDTEARETIRLPLDGSFTKLKKVERTGIRNFAQAWFHANREYYRLRNQRLVIDTEVTADGRALLPNARIGVVDNTRFKSYDGEVVAQSGLTLTLSCDVAFLPATAHSIILVKRDGSLQSIACTEVVGSPNKVLLAGAPAEAIVTAQTPTDGIRTMFSFAADSARAAQAWLVQDIEPTDGQYVRIRAVNYSDAYYTADSEAVPDKAGVIN